MKVIFIFVAFIAMLTFLCLPTSCNGNKRDGKGGGGTFRRKKPSYTDRASLIHELTETYNNVVPGAIQNKVEFGISINTIIQLISCNDTSNDVLITRATLHLKWYDERLTWNPSNNNGIKKLALPVYRIWKPQVILYNSYDDGFDSTLPVPAIINEKGMVQYHPIGIFRSTCDAKLEGAEEDTQICTLKFGLAYHEEVDNIDLVWEPNLSIIGNYEPNPNWELVNVTTTKTMTAGSNGHDDVARQGLHLILKLHRRGP